MIASLQHLVFASPVTQTAIARSLPIGATLPAGAANNSVFSRGARTDLLFFDRVDDARLSRVMAIDPFINRTHSYCHVFVPRVDAGQIYGFRASGPFDPERGVGFGSSKLLLDPYARAIAAAKLDSRDAACSPGDNAPALAAPHHTCERNADQRAAAKTCRAAGRSVVVLVTERIGSPCSCN